MCKVYYKNYRINEKRILKKINNKNGMKKARSVMATKNQYLPFLCVQSTNNGIVLTMVFTTRISRDVTKTHFKFRFYNFL